MNIEPYLLVPQFIRKWIGSMERTLTPGGTDITDTIGKYYIKLKKLLVDRGVDTDLITPCLSVHELRSLGIAQGALTSGETETANHYNTIESLEGDIVQISKEHTHVNPSPLIDASASNATSVADTAASVGLVPRISEPDTSRVAPHTEYVPLASLPDGSRVAVISMLGSLCPV